MNTLDETPRPPVTPEFGAVVPNGPIHVYPLSPRLEVRKRSVGGFDNNCYLIRCVATNAALLIDGASEPELLVELVGDADLVAIAQTHGHWDHVQALADLIARWPGIPVYACPGDEYPVPITLLADGSTLTVGELEITVGHRPGHTPGSTVFTIDGFLFAGDTLFPGGPGSTNEGGDFPTIMVSVDDLFATHDDETQICPGHGLDSTIGRERPHVETWRRRGW